MGSLAQPSVALIDTGSGNLRSAERALLAAGERAGVPHEVRVTDDPDFVRRADRVVLPGQGAFGECMAGLRARDGLLEALTEAVIARGAPFLGICVGMQLLAARGEESGAHVGLGWIGGICRPLLSGPGPIPHMGWNEARPVRAHGVLDALGAGAHVYFAHSFVVADGPADAVAAQTTHNEPFTSVLARDNLLGVQFHPEKSQAVGLALLGRFLEWRP